MIVNRFDVPGYREAVERESNFRTAAFLNLPAGICGLEIRQMSARDYLILDGIGCKLLTDEMPSRLDILHFLWLMSSDYSPSNLRWILFRWTHRRLNCVKAFFLIRQYLESTFQDAPRGSGRNSSSRAGIAGWCAYYVDVLASEYGWSLERCMTMPLRIGYQQIRCITKRHNPREFIPNASDAITGEHLRLKNERNKLLDLLKLRAANGG